MCGQASPGNSRRTERGGISWVTLLLIVVLVGGGYLAWVWVPIYLDHYAVKQVVRDYMNQAVKNSDDDRLRRNMVHKIRAIRDVEALDAHGRPGRVPAVTVDERYVQWERDARSEPPTLHVAFTYERQVLYPILDRAEVRIFEVDLTGELTRPDWGPTR